MLVRPKNILPLADLVWEKNIPQLGVGSPRLVDMNNDGTLDIFIGSGFEWSDDGESAMLLINGRTGNIMWRTETPKSVYGTPVLIDINNDQRLDVTVSGRFPDFYMMNGRDGDILWRLSEKNPNLSFLPCNFNSPVRIPDQDGDGILDILVIQGGLADDVGHIKIYDYETGDVLVEKYNKKDVEESISEYLKKTDKKELLLKLCQGDVCEVKSIQRNLFERYTFDVFMSKLFFNQEGPGGRVYVISSKTGHVIRYFPVPNNRETWSIPVFFTFQERGIIVYGSGGERKDGYLLAQDYMTGKELWHIKVKNKGIISSPIMIIEKKIPIIIATTMNGNIIKANALTGERIWDVSVGTEYETYSSPAVLKRDDGFDIVSIFSYGVWPKYQFAKIFILDSQTGTVRFSQKIGYCNAASSPIIADVDNDNKEDILLVTCADRQARLLVYNHEFKEIFSYDLKSGGFSTPIISDIDNDTHLDIIVPRFHFMNRFRFKDQSTSLLPLHWNQYRGKNWSGRR